MYRGGVVIMSGKLTIYDVPHLSVQQFKGADMGEVYFVDGKKTKIYVSDGYLLFRSVDTDFQYKVKIDHTKVGYGERLWFRCPICEVRTGRLYRMGYYKCRKCSNLTYPSCQISGNKLRQLNHEVRKRQQQLGMNATANIFSPDHVGIEDTPTFKPKYMKQDTFDRLLTELEIVQIHRIEAWLNSVR